MAQTTGAFDCSNAKVEISSNGTVWTDISGFSAKVSPGEQVRKTGGKYTHDGDTVIITSGKREPMEIAVDIVFTQGTGDPFEVVRAAFETKTTAFYLRYAPKGPTAANFLFTAALGVVSSLTYPDADAESADPGMFSFRYQTASITKSTVST